MCFLSFYHLSLQNRELHGRRLLIKFPDNPIIEGQPRTTVLKKTTSTPQPQQTKQNKQQQQKQQQQAAAQKANAQQQIDR